MAIPKLSMREIRKRAGHFAADWADETYERGESQTFWSEFLSIFGIERRRVAFFEKRAERFSTGNWGFIDMLWPGMLLVEQKSAGKDLDAADVQAFDYLNSLTDAEFPKAVVVSDFARIKLTRFDSGRPVTEIVETKSLSAEIDRFAFLAGYVKRDFSRAQEAAVNAKAVRLIGGLYSTIQADHYSDHDTSVFLTRILFLLFGDDTGLWQRGLFYDLVERSGEDGEALGGLLRQLFDTLDKPETDRSRKLNEDIAAFPHANGGLFSEPVEVPAFDSTMRQALLNCCAFDWGAVNPAVFGSMFQVVKSKADRHQLGEHYTGEEQIRRTIDPLFLDDLRSRVEAAGSNTLKLGEVLKELGRLRVMDVACGCGNFLVVAYREMRMLELDILRRIHRITGAQVLGDYDVASELQVKQSSFYGIEIEEWPARIAQTALFIVNHQMNLVLSEEFGTAPELLPIHDAATIVRDNAIRIDWRTVLTPSDDVVIASNPPFVGMARMSEEQQQDNRLAFGLIKDFGGERTGRLDYVAAWYGKALDYIRGTKARVAFVSTNSVIQGDSARALDPILRRAGVEINFGHRTFKWTSESPNAAAVHVVIVGFSRVGSIKGKRLFDYPDIDGGPVETKPTNLNFYLIDSDLQAPIKRRSPFVQGLSLMVKGSQPTDGQHLIVEPDQYAEVSSDVVAAKYLRVFLGARNLLHNGPEDERWCLWFVRAKPSDLTSSALIRQRLEEVAKFRRKSPTASVREAAKTPSLFTQIRQPGASWLAVPRHSSESREYIPMAVYPPEVIASDAVSYIADPPLWLFGVLESRAFTAWTATFAGRLKSDFRISPDLTYNSFPLIEPSGQMRTKIESAAQAVIDARSLYSGEALSDLYSPVAMPPELRKAHDRLDLLVDSLYGMKNPTEAHRAEVLLAKHHELVNAAMLAAPDEPKQTKRPRKSKVGKAEVTPALIEL